MYLTGNLIPLALNHIKQICWELFLTLEQLVTVTLEILNWICSQFLSVSLSEVEDFKSRLGGPLHSSQASKGMRHGGTSLALSNSVVLHPSSRRVSTLFSLSTMVAFEAGPANKPAVSKTCFPRCQKSCTQLHDTGANLIAGGCGPCSPANQSAAPDRPQELEGFCRDALPSIFL